MPKKNEILNETPGANQTLESYYAQPELWDGERFAGSPLQQRRARLIAALLDPQVETVLDVGCGNGFITQHLRARKSVVGLDPSETALAGFTGLRVVGLGDRLPFDDRSFDAVLCAEVLEHLSDEVLAGTLHELTRVAERYLIIGVPYRQDLRLGMTQCGQCGRRYHVDLHQRSFNEPDDIERLFPDFGLESTVFLGARHENRSRIYRFLRQLLLIPDAQATHACCPHCDSKETFSYQKQGGAKIRRWFFDGLGWRMHKTRVPHWIMVLLKRR